jgi:hypothetical protein
MSGSLILWLAAAMAVFVTANTILRTYSASGQVWLQVEGVPTRSNAFYDGTGGSTSGTARSSLRSPAGRVIG